MNDNNIINFQEYILPFKKDRSDYYRLVKFKETLNNTYKEELANYYREKEELVKTKIKINIDKLQESLISIREEIREKFPEKIFKKAN
jgi:hypothetical protein